MAITIETIGEAKQKATKLGKPVKLGVDEGLRLNVSKSSTVFQLRRTTNKNRDAGGKVVFSCTSDIVDGVNCAYKLDVNADKSGVNDKAILFENVKSRGDGAQ